MKCIDSYIFMCVLFKVLFKEYHFISNSPQNYFLNHTLSSKQLLMNVQPWCNINYCSALVAIHLCTMPYITEIEVQRRPYVFKQRVCRRLRIFNSVPTLDERKRSLQLQGVMQPAQRHSGGGKGSLESFHRFHFERLPGNYSKCACSLFMERWVRAKERARSVVACAPRNNAIKTLAWYEMWRVVYHKKGVARVAALPDYKEQH